MQYFSDLSEILLIWKVCGATKKKVPAWTGERLQLDSLPPLLICLIKRYKHEMNRKFAPALNFFSKESMVVCPF